MNPIIIGVVVGLFTGITGAIFDLPLWFTAGATILLAPIAILITKLSEQRK